MSVSKSRLVGRLKNAKKKTNAAAITATALAYRLEWVRTLLKDSGARVPTVLIEDIRKEVGESWELLDLFFGPGPHGTTTKK